MNQKKLSELTDQELLQEYKKIKASAITNAVLIGFLFGIVIFSFVKNTWGFLTLIPLYLAHKLMNGPTYDKTELENLLKERNVQQR